MPVTVDGVELYNARDSQSTITSKVDQTNWPTSDTDQTFLFSAEKTEDLKLTGEATAPRLAADGAYSSDAFTALAEWVAEYMALAHPGQGSGVTATDDERDGRSINVVVQQAGYTWEAEAQLEVSWDFKAIRGQGLLTSKARSAAAVSPSSSSTFAGYDLGSVMQKRENATVDVKKVPYMNLGVDKTDIKENGGARRKVVVSGRKTGTKAGLKTFHDNMVALNGDNLTHTYDESFPGRSLDMMVDSYQDTWRAGVTRMIDYNLTLVEGVTVSQRTGGA